MSKTKEVTGYLIREEKVSPLNHDILKNTFVIDVCHPFPGFYGATMKDIGKPNSIIFATNIKYTWEKILRATKKINKFMDTPFEGAYCEVYYGNQTYYGIRIKNLESFKIISTVQNAFMEEGFEFKKKLPLKKDSITRIKVKKFFKLSQLDEGIFKDLDQEGWAYLEIPEFLNWELFRKITALVKNNVSDRTYDAVEGIFYVDGNITDMIRIYKPKLALELLKEIRDKYLSEITKYL